MSKTIKKIKLQITFAILSFLLLNCSSADEYQSVFSTESGDVTVKKSAFYLNSRGTLFYFIADEVDRKKIIESGKIQQIKFKIGDNILIAKPIKVSFSRNIPDSDFMFLVKNRTNKLVVDTIDNKPMIVIIPNKVHDYNSLISQGVLKVSRLK